MLTRLSQAALVSMVVVGLGCQGTQTTDPPAETAPQASAPGQTTEADKTVYALGAVLGKDIPDLQLDEGQLKTLKRGFSDAAGGSDLEADPQEYRQKIQEFVQSRATAAAAAEKARSQDFLRQAAAAEGAVTTESGLVLRTLTAGSGASPAATDAVKVHYVGKLIDGTEFDSSRKRGQPAEFRLDQVVACWGEGLQKMKVGGTAQLVCPSSIAYGDSGRPPVIKPGATLVFEVELLDIVD